jgi:hypothetical protein
MGTAKIFPRLEQFEDFGVFVRAVREGGTGIGTGVKDPTASFCDEIADEINDEGTERFIASHPEWSATYQSGGNAKKLLGWCEARRIPKTLWNLSLAFGDLLADAVLEKVEPSQAPQADSRNPSIVLTVQNALAEYRPSDSEAEALKKCEDDVTLSDHARKNRDRKLALLAGQQRRQYATARKPDDREPCIVI